MKNAAASSPATPHRWAVIPDESPNRVPRRKPRAIPLDEIERLIAAVPQPINVFVDLIGRNGLRPAEARGLRWNRVDLDEATLSIDAQMNRENQLTKAKTKRSYRTIRVDNHTRRPPRSLAGDSIGLAQRRGSRLDGIAGMPGHIHPPWHAGEPAQHAPLNRHRLWQGYDHPFDQRIRSSAFRHHASGRTRASYSQDC